MSQSSRKFQHNYLNKYLICDCTVVGDNINIMKTTFELNFDFYQAFKQHGYTKIWKQLRSCQFKKLHFNYL